MISKMSDECGTGVSPVMRSPKMEGLSVGRIVHYVDEVSVHCAAVVIDLDSETEVDIFVMVPTGALYHEYGVPFDATGERNHSWHWPERV